MDTKPFFHSTAQRQALEDCGPYRTITNLYKWAFRAHHMQHIYTAVQLIEVVREDMLPLFPKWYRNGWNPKDNGSD